MDQRRVRRELLMRITAELASGPEDRYGPEARALAECCVYNRRAKTWELRLGDLGADALGRLAALLRAALEHGTKLELNAIIAPHAWRDPVLAWPVPLEPFQTDQGDTIDPGGASTMLVIDVNPGPNGPAQHWWLAAEPPLGTHPRLEEACRLLREFDDDDDPFAPFNAPLYNNGSGRNRRPCGASGGAMGPGPFQAQRRRRVQPLEALGAPTTSATV